MTYDARQIEFPFDFSTKGKEEGAEKMEALYKVRSFNCSENRHQLRPNGTCMWCRQQIAYGSQDETT